MTAPLSGEGVPAASSRVAAGWRDEARLVARVGVRRVRRHLRALRTPRPDHLVVPVRSGAYELRPLAWADGPSWSRSMRANEERMRPWWPAVDDWQRATDRVAFADHYLDWQARRRAGTGLPLAIIGPAGLIGEFNTWHLSPGGLSAEAAIWVYPRLPRRDLMALWCGYFDNMLGNLGLEQVASPVAAGNAGPLRMIRTVGGTCVARIPRYREVAGALADQDLYSLTRENWLRTRQGLYDEHPWSHVTDALPPLTPGGATTP